MDDASTLDTAAILAQSGFRLERDPMPGDSDELIVSMGPQHPATHGVLRLLLRTDGEVVREAVPQLGYLHRCAEKIGESLTYDAYTPYTDRFDYLAAMNNNWTWAMAVEKLSGIEVPRRAEYIRVIVGELNRIASHLVMIGTFGMDMGAFTPFLYAFRERETILDLFEMICGARLCYGYVRIGGVTDDVTSQFVEGAKKFVRDVRPMFDQINELLTYNNIFIGRTGNVAVVPPNLAVSYGLTGPNLRGSGVGWDLRRDEPYSIYPELNFNVCVGSGRKGTVGDCWDRYMVRMEEMYESLDICEQCLEGLPEGDSRAKVKRVFKPPKAQSYFRAENPRGELAFFIVSDGTTVPARVKVRGPSFCNLSVLQDIVQDMLIADTAAFFGSIDVVMGEVDR